MSTGKVRMVFRHFAFLGEESIWAAEAAECAADQGRFWEYYDLLYANQAGENRGAFTKNRLKGFAANLGLDLPTFYSCLDSDSALARVQEETRSGLQLGAGSSPTFFILGPVVDANKAPHEPPNSQKVIGAQAFGTFREIIEQQLSK